MPNNKRWTEKELDLVRQNIVPPTRTLVAARCIASRYKIQFTTRTELPDVVQISGKNIGHLIGVLRYYGERPKGIAELLGIPVHSVLVYHTLYLNTLIKETK